MNRASTNDFVLRKANEEMKKYKPNSNEIKLFPELVREKRIKLAGHILRTSKEDPLRQVSQKTRIREYVRDWQREGRRTETELVSLH